MSDWKEELITACIELHREKGRIELERARDEELQNAERRYAEAKDKLAMLKQPYNDRDVIINAYLLEKHAELIAKWDITGKTYECKMGTATIRTTKALNIVDERGLIATLLKIGKLSESIRSWNLSYLRRLKDVDMIKDTVASYEEHQNVVLKGAT